jgi:hypothetical protein
MVGHIVNTFGLVVAIVGCIFVYKYGLPPSVDDPSGKNFLLLEGTNQAAITTGKAYRHRGNVGILLVGIGSALQIIATWMGGVEAGWAHM